MCEILAIFQDVKAGVLPHSELLPVILWRLLRSASEAFL